MSHKLCMIPGPVEVDACVNHAMATLATSHVDPGFIETFGRTLELLRIVFQSGMASQPFVLAGSGTLTWDITAANLVERGEKVLVVNTGVFADWFAECIEVYGGVVDQVTAPFGDRPSLDQIQTALKMQLDQGTPYKLITLTHVDTSTSVLLNIQEIAAMVRKTSPSTLIAVDGVCSIGAETLRQEEWGIDVAMTASQKALGVPPGLAVMVFSDRAMKVALSRTVPPTTYYGSLAKWLPIMKKYEARQPSYFATPPVQLIMALHASLQEFSQDMDGRFEKHAAVSDAFKASLLKHNLKIVPVSHEKAGFANFCQHILLAHTLTAVYFPPGITGPSLIPKITARGVVIAGGLHPVHASEYFRIGHMGVSAVNQDLGHVEKTVQALMDALSECGYKA